MRVGRAAGVTDTGRRRLRNEDAFVCEPPLFAVADGMGGAKAGETAARVAATALEESGGRRGRPGRARRAHRRGEPPDLGAGTLRSQQGRNGDDRHGGARRLPERQRRDRARRRLARVSGARRRPRAADDGSLARCRAGLERRPHPGGGRAAPAALRDHASARHRAHGRGRGVHRRRRAGRPLPDLLRRPPDDGQRRRGRGGDPVRRTGIRPRLPRHSSRPRTPGAARTTSRSCCSSSSRARRSPSSGRPP